MSGVLEAYMPDIKGVQSIAPLHATEKANESNTRDLEASLRLLLNEARRHRIGDTDPEDKDVLE